MRRAYSYIRFSTPEQRLGDSARRQIEASRSYAETHGMQLDELLRDEGLSAYHGMHKSHGELGTFIAAVEAGEVTSGSVLIVESLDRLSRETIDLALEQFMSLLRAGIEIVTLTDNRRYDKSSLSNLTDLIVSLSIMSRAHEESATKAERVSAAWDQKRKLAAKNKKPMTARCPWWLQLRDDRSGYDVIPEAAKIVKSIFHDTIKGIGRRIIATKLNEAGVEPIGDGKRKGKQWHSSIIAKTLDNRAVFGEFQPCRKQDRQPVGEPIHGYYPAVIDESTFYKAQQATQSRRIARGRTGKRFGNLFTGCCKCLECNGTVRYQDKGPKPKGGKYLFCDSNHMHSGCSNRKRWRYELVEATALIDLYESVDWTAVYSAENDDKREIESKLVVAQAKLTAAEHTRDRFQSLFINASDAMLAEATVQYQNAVEAVSSERNTVKKLEESISAYTPAQRNVDNLVEAFGKLQVDGTYEDRAHINNLLKRAGLELWFDKDGVVWRVGNQKGILLSADNDKHDEIMLVAAALNASFAVNEMNRKVAEAEKQRRH